MRTEITEKLNISALVGYFKSACKDQELIGAEFETIGVLADTGRALPYKGKASVETVAAELDRRFGWKTEHNGGTIYLHCPNSGVISLEPGGQFELSTVPSKYVDDHRAREERHLTELNAVGRPLGILWSGHGLQPVSTVEEVDWITKERYAIMREFLSARGKLAHEMMKLTASVQVTLDFHSEDDAAQKIGLAVRLAPVLTAIFANSCIKGGAIAPFKSTRSHIWQNTDPDRCGLVEAAFRDSFSFRDWVEYALDVPMFFIEREGKLLDRPGKTFRKFLKEGIGAHQATIEDWDRHLTTLFPEVRLRKYIEIRSCDRQGGLYAYAAPALIKVLMYDDAARTRAKRFLGPLGWRECSAGMAEAARKGLDGEMGGFSLADLASEVVAIAEDAAKNAHAELVSDFEKSLIGLLSDRVVRDGVCPADDLIRRHEAGESVLDIVRSTAI